MENNIQFLFFDWGDTLMIDYPQYSGAMAQWSQITPMEGVPELLPKLSAKYNCVVLSNAVESDFELMKAAFKKVNLERYFRTFFTSKELGEKKPEVAFFINALYALNADPERSIMIGNDYVKDIETAKKVGMHTILISNERGEYPNADCIVNDFWGLSFLLSHP